MFDKHCLSADQVQRAIAAVLREASSQPERPVAVALVDDRGDLLGYARMDRTPPWPANMALRKAYTSVMMRSDTLRYQERLRQNGGSPADSGDPKITSGQGGLLITFDGQIVGGIGVSGNTGERDEELARIGLSALDLPRTS
jgi:uncharacterized protein GlcG (DUF336 family)